MTRHETPARPTLLGAARRNALPLRMLPQPRPRSEAPQAKRRPRAIAALLLLAATIGAALVAAPARQPPSSAPPAATAPLGVALPPARAPAVIESMPSHVAIETPTAAPARPEGRPATPTPAATRRSRPVPPRPAVEPADPDVDLLAAMVTRLQATEPCRTACLPSPDPSDVPRAAAR